MSYILEALKKSEQERNPDRVPDLSTHHEQIVVDTKKPFPWLWLVIALVGLNLFVVYWLFFQQPVQQTTQPVMVDQKPTEQVTQAETVVETPSVIEESNPSTTVVTEQQSETPTVTESISQPVAAEPIVTEAPVPQPVQQPVQSPRVLGFNELPHVSELSLSIQNQLPGMAFSTHIYVEDGGSFVIINNKNLSDGMSMGEGLVLERIVREGVIMSFRNRYFTLNSMESWTP